MARRETFPFLTSFVAFLAVCCVDAFACSDGYYTSTRPGGGLMGGGPGCQKCPDGYNHSDTNANNQEQCYKISSRGVRIYYGSSTPGSSSHSASGEGSDSGGGRPGGNSGGRPGSSCPGGISIHCPENYYLPPDSVNPLPCRAGCTCQGGNFCYSDRTEQGIDCGGTPRQCDPGKYYEDRNDSCENCPTKFPLSAANSVGRESCYGTYNNKKIYYKEYNCPAGNYLPKKTDTYESCLTLPGYACPGGKFFPSPSIDQGLIQCLSGKTPNSSHTQCVSQSGGGQTQCVSGQYYTSNTCKDCPTGFSASDTDATKKEQCYTVVDGTKLYYKSIKCDPGTYLKKSSGSCSACADGYVCYGGTYWTSTTQDQGLKTCPSGKIPNANQTGCTDKENYGTVVNCEPGEYLPAGLGRCRKCSDNKKYCPGGQLTSSTTDQGLIDCPYGATANSGHTSCNFTLNQNRLKFGPKGKSTPFTNQCWTLINTYDYAKCVLKTTGPITGGGAIKDEKQQTEQVQNYAPDLK